MERVTLKARRREETGSNRVRRLRLAGLVPGVVYGRGREPMPVAVDGRALREALRTHAGLNVLIDLAVGNGEGQPATVMVKEIQRDVIRRDIIHVDFYAIDLTRTLEARVPLVFVGQPAGVAEGGVLDIHLREVVVECLPTAIPDQLEVDVSGLGVGDSIHVRDLRLPPGVTMVSAPDEAVASVVQPRVAEEAAPAAAEAPAAETPAAPAEARPAGDARTPEARPEKTRPERGPRAE
ncbi:MAG: 50S ribosomal protein L25 [Armatimonadota bacterium]|nr:50S ribosomal protein L25 [Armatimonadota bacterium]MDR7401899.1 50S ribosomal protein L25 [Armatimonadota bacterium]MDR7404520.1 50S ribosomal protein L25 [Armatimonadota bacterium]MDR7438134.1 50S ribosomal protein L25 [Armatimonadota bacterium]MDR7471550.1 50S ribosomal protein L25 [Armatimonadota bacterium]